MNKRIINLLNKFEEKNIDSMIIHDNNNRRYLSGFTGSSGYLYISKNRRVLLTDFRYLEQGDNQAVGYEIIDHNKIGLYETLNNLLQEDGADSVGFEAESLSYTEYISMKNKLKDVTLIETKGLVEEIRMIKDEEELKVIKKAASIADKAFEHILSYIKPGVRETDISLELEYFMKNNGAQKLSFDTIVATGKHSSLCHAEPGELKVMSGDFVTMDFGCMVNGYCSDMTRTIVVGSASEKQKEIYHIVLEAQLSALEALKSGRKGSEIDKIARDIISKAGYGDYFGHGLGHSVGLEIHENPRLSMRDDTILQHNMMMTVEPGIYVPDFGGVRIEDLVCIKDGGYDNFNTSIKELIEL